MKMMKIFRLQALAAAIFTLGYSSPAHADVALIGNGGFESGLAGWTVADQLGGDGTFSLQNGTTSPLSGATVPAPPGGTNAAMSDGNGPGSHVLYQDFNLPSSLPNGTLTFSLFVGNRASNFFNPSPNTLDFTTAALNQQARVDILRGGTDPFSVAPADVLLNVLQTKAGDSLVAGYISYSFDVSQVFKANAGQSLRLRFAETDNVFNFQLGVDNVSLIASVPEPSIPALAGILALGWVGKAWHRGRRASSS